MTDATLGAFLVLAAVVIMTPGQDTALTIRNTLLGGRPAGIATAAGVAIGQAGWTVAATLGLTAILIAWTPVYEAIRWLGAAYLVYLGVESLRRAVRPAHAGGVEPSTGAGSDLGPRRALRHGILSNLGNPKMAIFFSSLLPQFVLPGPGAAWSMLVLGGLFVTMTLGWLSLYATVIDRAGDLLRRSRVRRTLDAVMGALLVAFGLRLATASR